jgi:hypothetical protein
VAHVSTVLTHIARNAEELAALAGIPTDTARKQLKFLRESGQVDASQGGPNGGNQWWYSLLPKDPPAPVPWYDIYVGRDASGVGFYAHASIDGRRTQGTGTTTRRTILDLKRNIRKLCSAIDRKAFDREWRYALKTIQE